MLELLKLALAVLQIVHLVVALTFKNVLITRGGRVKQYHPVLYTSFKANVFIQINIRPEIDQLDALVHGAEAVNTAETLDNAYRIPMNIVVNQTVAVLKILPFRNTVSCEYNVDFAVFLAFFRQLFGFGGEVGKCVLESGTGHLQCGLSATGTGHECAFNAIVGL